MSNKQISFFLKIQFSFTVALVCLLGQIVRGQNLDVISLKKGAKVNGSINLNAVGYKAFGLEQRRDPFNWFLNGSINFTLFGYSAPFSFSYSNANTAFSQPFNQFRFAPQYKWIKTYTGNTSMSFSPYTLSGHMFFGGGVDLTPGKWRISAMYGRLRQAVQFSLDDTLQHTQASFKRIGYGLKVGYETNGDAIGVSIFAAKDDPTSLLYIPIKSNITPQQNVAVSISFRKKLFSKLSLDVEYGVSAMNTNARAGTEAEGSTTPISNNLLQGLLPNNTTSRYFDAVNASLGYQGKNYVLNLKYERIAPEYQTLGAYYFNNDMRNITIAPGVRLFKNKLNLNANVGLQENNLDKTRASTSSRVVGAFNMQFAPNAKWNISSNYSNFSAFTKVRPPNDPFFRNGLDTLNFYQVSETTTGSISYSFGKGDAKQSVAANGSYQNANNQAAGTAPPQLSDFVNGSFSYSYSLAPANLTLSLAITASSNSAAGTRTSFFGPAINASKSLFEKMLRASYSTSYSQTSSSGAVATSPVWSNQLSFSYTPTGKKKKDKEGKEKEGSSKSNFSLGINMLRRLQGTEQQPAFTELTSTLNYSYSF